MRVTLAVPDLLAADRAALARSAPLARVAAYAAAAPTEAADLDAALVAAAGLPADTPTAPLAAAGAGAATGDAYVLRADPVALVAGRDDVLLAGRVDDLADADAAALVAVLAEHFAADGLAFHAPRPEAWFVAVRGDARPDTTPLPALRGAIGPHLPRGAHGAVWRRWLSEMQMLLHEHPVNAAREARGQARVTGIWISDGGTLPGGALAHASAYCAPPGRAGDVARGLARTAGADAASVPAGYAALAPGTDYIVVLPPLSAADALPALEHAWLAPALAALERGSLVQLTLIASERDAAAWTWTAARPPVTRRIGARLAPRAFAVPARVPA